MSCERPDQPVSGKLTEFPNKRPSLNICETDRLSVLCGLMSEKVSRQKQIIRRKYMNHSHLEVISGGGQTNNDNRRLRPTTPAAVLQELFELLEDYSPVWYTQENHDRAIAALTRPS